MLRYVITVGMLAWGGVMFGVMGVAPAFLSFPFEPRPIPHYWLWTCSTWFGTGLLFGITTWYANEWQFRKYANPNRGGEPDGKATTPGASVAIPLKESDYVKAWVLYYVCTLISGVAVGAGVGALAGAIVDSLHYPKPPWSFTLIRVVGIIFGAVISYVLFRFFVSRFLIRKIYESSRAAQSSAP